MRGDHLSISKVAALYGLTLRTLRFYEDRGLLQPVRIGTGRFYTPKDRVRIELILKGKQLGFTLAEIEALILGVAHREGGNDEVVDIALHLEPSRIAQKILVLERKRDQIDVAIEELRSARGRSGDTG